MSQCLKAELGEVLLRGAGEHCAGYAPLQDKGHHGLRETRAAQEYSDFSRCPRDQTGFGHGSRQLGGRTGERRRQTHSSPWREHHIGWGLGRVACDRSRRRRRKDNIKGRQIQGRGKGHVNRHRHVGRKDHVTIQWW